MYKRPFILLLALLTAVSAHGQELTERKRGWGSAQTQQWLDAQAAKPYTSPAYLDCSSFTNRRDAIMNGNKITSQIFNFGSISAPGNTITDIVWNGLGYGYEFSPFVAARAEVVDPQTGARHDTVIVSDGLTDGGEVSDTGDQYWSWQPIPCAEPVGAFEGLRVVNPNSDKIPTNDAPDENRDGKPDSWPEDWYNETLNEYVWPGALQQGASNAEKEALYFMNDYQNREFNYYPFPSDSSKRGLGLEVETRLYQWSNPLAEDVIFLIYKITNKSEKDLNEVIFGMWGDPHVGGPGDYADDLASFDDSLNMVYTWDDDGRSDIAGREPGYFGYKFLESPGVGTEIIDGERFEGDGIDNDNDGLVDESWTDGIDNDGDWDPDTDDVGVDGIDGTGDEGEGDGEPTAGSQFDITRPGEPNYEFTDLDESDMIGLTSFASPPYGTEQVRDDDGVWDLIQPGNFESIPNEPADYVFIYGSGKFKLRAGETKRFSIALILGENREDLTLNAQTAQQIYNADYRFAKPPRLPTVRAVPGDKKVTLYWDDRAEGSVDPLTDEEDFEGYAIYRSTDPSFSDKQTITDINGSKFLYEPLEDENGVPAKFDLKNGIEGVSSIPFPQRGVAFDLGDDTGLQHSYVDSNNVVNGQRYFYAVTAYDRGYEGTDQEGFANGIPPTETSKTITYDPTTDTYFYNRNTTSVVPSPRVAGFVPPSIEATGGLEHTSGRGTGDIRLEIVNELDVRPDNPYRIQFDQTDGTLTYSVTNEKPVEVRFAAVPSKFTSLDYQHILSGSFQLSTKEGTTLQQGSDYELNPQIGSVKPLDTAPVSQGDTLVATFRYQPVYQNENMTFQRSARRNLVFDGLRLGVNQDPLGINREKTGWAQGGDGLSYDTVRTATAGPNREPQPYDYEIRFRDEPVTTSLANDVPLPFEVINLTRANQQIDVFAPDNNRNNQWDPNESIIFVETLEGEQTASWEVTLTDDADASRPGDGDVFFIETTKPFTSQDAFRFRTQAARVDDEQAQNELDDIYVVPNPYTAYNQLEPNNPVSRTERGQRRLYFANVPKTCTIRIYTLAGELVDVIEHNGQLEDGKAYWNLRTKDNMNISYGLYIYHVESPQGTHTGKFAIIK